MFAQDLHGFYQPIKWIVRVGETPTISRPQDDTGNDRKTLSKLAAEIRIGNDST